MDPIVRLLRHIARLFYSDISVVVLDVLAPSARSGPRLVFEEQALARACGLRARTTTLRGVLHPLIEEGLVELYCDRARAPSRTPSGVAVVLPLRWYAIPRARVALLLATRVYAMRDACEGALALTPRHQGSCRACARVWPLPLEHDATLGRALACPGCGLSATLLPNPVAVTAATALADFRISAETVWGTPPKNLWEAVTGALEALAELHVPIPAVPTRAELRARVRAAPHEHVELQRDLELSDLTGAPPRAVVDATSAAERAFARRDAARAAVLHLRWAITTTGAQAAVLARRAREMAASPASSRSSVSTTPPPRPRTVVFRAAPRAPLTCMAAARSDDEDAVRGGLEPASAASSAEGDFSDGEWEEVS